MINTVLDEVYMSTVSDVTTYYVKVQGQTIDIVNYWYEQVGNNTENDKNTNENNNENTSENAGGNENTNDSNQNQAS